MFDKTIPLSLWIVLLVSIFVAGCGKRTSESQTKTAASGTSSKRDSHKHMLNELNAIKYSIPRNIFLGNAQLDQLRKDLAGVPEDDPQMRGVLTFEMGVRNVSLGNVRQGIKEQEAAHELLKRANVPQSTLDKLYFSLGVAHFRLAETENCINAHTYDSCIFPIRGGGVHVRPEEAGLAIEYFEKVLNSTPDHLSARWLLNVAFMASGGYPEQVPPEYLIPPESLESDEEFPRFIDRAPDLGLDTFSLAGGSIVDDFDGDHLLDIVVSSWGPADQLRYFHNQGDGTFVEQTESAGLKGIFGGLNLIQADYDNDSDVDVFVLRGGWLAESGRHPNSLLQNNGKGQFRDVTFDAGLAVTDYPTQTASWSDYDNDGDLDLYIGNEGFANQLFQNQSDGTFIDVAKTARVDDPTFTKGVVWGDYNNDRFPDLYVSNLDGANRLYHNRGDGTFVDRAPELGVTRPITSFPVLFWDFNNDGALDLFVTSFFQSLDAVAADYLGFPPKSEMDCLYQGDGKGGFREVANEMNIRHVSQPMGSNFGDLDNDGYLDLYLGTGFPELEALVPNLMYHNHGGTGFSDITSAGGFGHLQKGHAVSFADLDNDGDQDIFQELGGWFAGDAFGNALFENPGFGNHWIKLKLIGQQSNRSAIGARIRIDVDQGDQPRSIYRWVNSGGSFGANPLQQHIGLGEAEQIKRLEIYWPSTDRTQEFHDVDVDQFLTITEGQTPFTKIDLQPFKFSSVRSSADHDHHQHEPSQHGEH